VGKAGRRPGTYANFPACEIRITSGDVTLTRVSSQRWNHSLRQRILKQKGVESIELVRRLTREEYESLRDHGTDEERRFRGFDRESAAVKQLRRDERYAAVELVATFEDGREERSIVRRASGRRQMDKFESMPGFKSVVVVRRLTMVEWKALHGEASARRGRGRRVEPATAAGVEAKSTPSGPYAWEVLIRQDGRPWMTRVAGATEAVAIELAMAMEGVDAAIAIRPLTLAEYREAARQH
jgi:hypothetical protein